MIVLDPQPDAQAVPARMPSPFAPGPPHPLARRAADELCAELGRRGLTLGGAGQGKMFGVLVVAAPDGTIGVLRGFSGMLEGRWFVDGFVPPLFDAAARDAFWPAGEDELRALEARLAELDGGAEVIQLRAAHAALIAAQQDELARMIEVHAARKAHRRRLRAAATLDAAGRHALDQESRGDTAERRRLDARHAEARAALEGPLAAIAATRAEVEALRAARSRGYLRRIHDGYLIASARGVARPLRELFAPHEPPGGAGDCAAPKLLGEAYRRGLRPLALAELWWGGPPPTGDRTSGTFYPACRGKCGVVLPHMLDGLDVEPAPRFGGARIDPALPRVVFEDAWLVVVDKPCGLLSVPGRGGALRDSVQARLRARYPDATGPLLVHRLDLDTSGLLLAAKRDDVHAALQRLFSERAIDKRYVAWLDGDLRGRGDAGVIVLPLRGDLDDRPRQIVDPVHGKAAITEWRVLARDGARTRVAFVPRTGRTHQLRVHAAHPDGLGAPIEGDRLYGRGGGRLQLHAEALGFTHPVTGARVELALPAPF